MTQLLDLFPFPVGVYSKDIMKWLADWSSPFTSSLVRGTRKGIRGKKLLSSITTTPIFPGYVTEPCARRFLGIPEVPLSGKKREPVFTSELTKFRLFLLRVPFFSIFIVGASNQRLPFGIPPKFLPQMEEILFHRSKIQDFGLCSFSAQLFLLQKPTESLGTPSERERGSHFSLSKLKIPSILDPTPFVRHFSSLSIFRHQKWKKNSR